MKFQYGVLLQEEAALYVTTTESLIKGETPEANLFIVYVLIMSGLGE